MKKRISSKWIIFLFGFLLGMLVFSTYKHSTDSYGDNKYFQLKNDYCIDDVGQLKSGTLLQIDEGMTEGFTRYILYLNISDGEKIEKYNTQEKDMIIPYWLYVKDTSCTE